MKKQCFKLKDYRKCLAKIWIWIALSALLHNAQAWFSVDSAELNCLMTSKCLEITTEFDIVLDAMQPHSCYCQVHPAMQIGATWQIL